MTYQPASIIRHDIQQFFIFSVLILAILSGLVLPTTAHAQVVRSFQKISSLEGGLTGPLEDFDDFGEALKSIGDLDGDGIVDLAVGTLTDDDGGENIGAVYILFLNRDGTVRDEQKISATQGGFTGELNELDYFGVGVTGLGDLDGDGIPDLAVGASRDDDGGNDRGAVWILFLNPDGTVKSHQKISSLEGDFTGEILNENRFGADLEALGDFDSDGIPDLVVSAESDDDGGPDRGAIWLLFLNSDGTVKSHQKISDTQGGFTGGLDDGDEFGQQVGLLGDLDLDGVPDLAVGVERDDDGVMDFGAVYILFLNADGTVKSHQKISITQGGFGAGFTADDFDINDQFGQAVASPGDINGDGIQDLIVGAEFDDDGGTKTGAAYLLTLRRDGTVSSTQKISSTQGDFATLRINDEFGQAATALGDLDLDGVNDIAITADGDNDGGRQRGAVYVIFLNGSSPAVNQPPVLSPIGDRMVTEGTEIVIPVMASDTDGPAPLTLDAVNLPVGATFNDSGNGSGEFRWTPPVGASANSPYRVTFRAIDGDGAIDIERIDIVVNAENTGGGDSGTGSLSGNTQAIGGTIDLTAEGSLDWAHWFSGNGFQRKADVTPLISNFSLIGNESPSGSGADATYSWTNGTPTPVNTASDGTRVFQVGNGFEITVPADTSARTLNLYLGVKNARGLLQASLSDGSAANFATLVDQPLRLGSHRVSLNYSAASAGQTLTVRFTMETRYRSSTTGSQINIESATLTGAAPLPPSDGGDGGAGGSSGVLIGAAPEIVNGTVDLTAEGSSDWTRWSSSNNLNRKAGVAEQISDFTVIGEEEPQGAGTAATYSWSNGTESPSGSASSATRVFQVGSGFEITAPADTSMRTLRLYIGAKNANGRLEVSLSDGSAPAYSTLIEQPSLLGSHVVEIGYQAASLDQQLIVRYMMDTRFRSGLTGSQINIEAATLQ